MPFILFVNGTLMRGLALHKNLEDASYLGEARTEPRYRLYSINNIHPGMFRLRDEEEGGISVQGELYLLTEEIWTAVEAGEPPDLSRETIIMEDGREVLGIVYPRYLAEGRHKDISSFGSWRAYIATLSLSR